MLRAIQAIKKISPLRAIVLTGTISMIIVIAGTAGFIVRQKAQLEAVEKKQACYLDLLELRGKLLECGVSRSWHNPQTGGEQGAISISHEQQKVIRLKYEKIAVEMQQADLPAFPSLRTTLLQWPAALSGKNLEQFTLELQKSIETAKIESKKASVQLLIINEYFLFFILVVLLSLSITAGWMLHNNYRQTLIPLAQLVAQLKLLNRNIPESIRDTAAEMKKELTDTDHSSDITQITESIMKFCGDIDAKNKKLDEIYIRDEKTNLYNYRHFKEHLIIDIERAKRLNDKVSLAMIDIDHFKLYNDSNGHVLGDQVLKALAEVMRNECRAYDVPSRFGGDEFALLFPKTTTHIAHDIAQRLRLIISETPFPFADGRPEAFLTVSIGVATFPDNALDWHTLISNADRALYKAKASGRNCVMTFDALEEIQQSEG